MLARDAAVGGTLTLPGPVLRCGKSPNVCAWLSRSEHPPALYTGTDMYALAVESVTFEPASGLGVGSNYVSRGPGVPVAQC